MTVRDRVPVRVIADRITSWSAAVLADQQRLEAEQWQVSDLSLRSWLNSAMVPRNLSLNIAKVYSWLQQAGSFGLARTLRRRLTASWFHADFSLPAALGGALRPASPALQGGMGNMDTSRATHAQSPGLLRSTAS